MPVSGEVWSAVAEDKIVPVCSRSAPRGFSPWQTVQVHTASVHLQAGFCGARPYVAHSRRFVRSHKHSRWFICAVAGPRAKKGDITAVKVLEDIRLKFLGTESCVDDATAVADTAAVAEVREDPWAISTTLPQSRRNAQSRSRRKRRRLDLKWSS